MKIVPGTGITLLFLLATGPVLSGSGHATAKAESTRWTTVPSVRQVPPDIIRFLEAHFPYDGRLADVGEPFDATDVLTGLPRRRLVLAGHSKTEWFVAYEHGGRGHHLDLVIFNTQGDAPVPVASFPVHTGRLHDDTKGWRLRLGDLQPLLDGPRPTVGFDANRLC